MEPSQKKAFLDYEADNYFTRNKNVKYDSAHDTVLTVLREYSQSPQRVLEIGCNTGYRLDAIHKEFNSEVTGVEPSSQAIALGQSIYPQISFVHGTADDMSALPSAHFDLIVIGFVLYVVDREILFKAIAETDRLLKNEGLLIIIDFFSEKPTRNAYQHIRDTEAFAFKQNYDEIFTASRLYHLLDKRSMSHVEKTYDASADFYNKYAITTLKKDIHAGYK